MSDSRDDGSLIKAASDEEGKMFVGGLSWETNEEKLRNYFEQFGAVRDCIVKRDPDSKRSRGFGFVLFNECSSVDTVLAPDKQHTLDGRTIDPKRAKALKKDHKLFVGGLNPDTPTDTIKDYFTKFGEVDSFERPVDRNTQKPRGFCFITFVKDGVIHDVISHGKFHLIDGRQCECKDGDPKKQAGRGGGGGGGQYPPAQFNNQYPQGGAAMGWYPPGAYPAGYDYNSGYGSYGSYGGPAYSTYGMYGYNAGGYNSYGSGYGGYGGEGYGGAPVQQAQQNTGGKTKTPGRGGQNNYKPY